MRRTLTVVVLALGLVAVAGTWYRSHAAAKPPQLTLIEVSRGNVVQTVECTGDVESPELVDVGSQVSGIIQWLGADFNALVHKGEVIARIDPADFQARVDAAKASLAKARADANGASVAVDEARREDGRIRALVAKAMSPQSDQDDADVALKEAEAQLHSADAAVAQAQGVLDQAEVDLAHTIITAPVDGIVQNRKVDVGQTVAAGYQAPSLFVIAANFQTVDLMAQVDESDIGGVRAGEPVRFHVDAYPDREFTGTVKEVRLQPSSQQMAVTYTVPVVASNPDLSLRPGMSATMAIETNRHDNTLRIPTLALRFQPTQGVLKALGEADLAKSLKKVPTMVWPGQTTQVWVGRANHLEPVTVTAGLSDGPYTEIVQGLREGSQVVVGAWLPQNGQ